jgi:hypothetical protein
MLVRDINGRLHIVSRNECKNDKDYYQKLVKLRSEYTKYYKSVIIIVNNSSNHLSK